MRRSVLALLPVVLLLCFAGCRQNSENSERVMAHNLYREISSTLKRATHSMKNANDSTTVDSLYVECQEKIDRIYLSYPADADLLISEGENDTLGRLFDDFIKARRERIHMLYTAPQSSDSTIISQRSQSKSRRN